MEIVAPLAARPTVPGFFSHSSLETSVTAPL
jgi:hypothetical protein